MASAHDIAAYILEQRGPMTALKLQKLLYYAQAWFLVCTKEPLFPERTEAWRSGPVQPDVYRHHVGKKMLKEWPLGAPSKLTNRQRYLSDAVLHVYGAMSPEELRDLTHRERPWSDAREGLNHTDRSKRELRHQDLVEFYSSQLTLQRRIKLNWLDHHIRDIYADINNLSKRGDKVSRGRLEKLRSVLRTLQEKHAALIAEEHDSRWLTPPKSGPDTVEKVMKLLERHEATSSRNASTKTSYSKKASA